jgi:hypothetical protein
MFLNMLFLGVIGGVRRHHVIGETITRTTSSTQELFSNAAREVTASAAHNFQSENGRRGALRAALRSEPVNRHLFL